MVRYVTRGERRDAKRTSGSNFLASSSNTDNDALAPSPVARLKRGTHHANISSAVESIVTSAISHLNQVFLNRLVAQLSRVHEIRGTELARPRLLAIVHVHNDDSACLVLHAALDDGETDTPGSEDGYVRALLDLGRNDCRAVASGDTAAEQAGAVHGGRLWDGHDRDIRDNGVLRERGCAHEVEEVFSAGAEAGGAVRHDAATLGCADLAAEIGLARLAELAFLALWGTVEYPLAVVYNLKVALGRRTIAQQRGHQASRR